MRTIALILLALPLAAFAQQPAAPTQENIDDANTRLKVLIEQRNEFADRSALLQAELVKVSRKLADAEKAATACKPPAEGTERFRGGDTPASGKPAKEEEKKK